MAIRLGGIHGPTFPGWAWLKVCSDLARYSFASGISLHGSASFFPANASCEYAVWYPTTPTRWRNACTCWALTSCDVKRANLYLRYLRRQWSVRRPESSHLREVRKVRWELAGEESWHNNKSKHNKMKSSVNTFCADRKKGHQPQMRVLGQHGRCLREKLDHSNCTDLPLNRTRHLLNVCHVQLLQNHSENPENHTLR